MNIRQFIGEVKKRKALWDQTSYLYHNKKALRDGWRDIAKAFNIEVPVAKQKWKNLRDTFRVELKKTKRYSAPEDPDAPTRSLWAYYEDMYFIKNILRTRRLTECGESYSAGPEPVEQVGENVKIEPDAEMTFSPTRLTDDNEYKDNSTGIFIENVTSLQHQIGDVDTTQASRRGVKRKKSDDDGHGDDEDQDDDLLFFRSLLPFVKRMDQDKKLLFRMNVQQLLYNQLYS